VRMHASCYGIVLWPSAETSHAGIAAGDYVEETDASAIRS
jgi:hypothetical protein